MRTNELTSEAAKRLRGAMTPAASLIMILLLTAWGLILASRALSLLIGSLFFEAAAEETLFSAVSAAIGIAELLLICDPLWLNARRWFFRLDEGFVPLRAAFYYVSSVALYRRAMCFTLVLTAIRFLSALLCFLPAAADGRYQTESGCEKPAALKSLHVFSILQPVFRLSRRKAA